MCDYVVNVLCIKKCGVGDAQSRVRMAAEPPLDRNQCPGTVVVTCEADRLVTVFWWLNDNPTPVARYTKPYRERETFPINISTPDTIRLGLTILITSSLDYEGDSQLSNFTTTLSTTVTNLASVQNIHKLLCGYNSVNATLEVSVGLRGIYRKMI